jgi:hypothetical protein
MKELHIGDIVKRKVRKDLREIQRKLGVDYCENNGAGMEGKIYEFVIGYFLRFPYQLISNSHIVFCEEELESPTDYDNEEMLDENN